MNSDAELKPLIKSLDTIDFNIGLKNIKSNTLLFINLCNKIKENNPEFKLEKVRQIFAQSFKHLFKNQDVPMNFLTAIQETDNKFQINRKVIC